MTCTTFSFDWGNVPAWITTVGVIIAALTYYRDRRDKEREQASKVTTWSSRSSILPPTRVQILPKYDDLTVTAKNGNDVAAGRVRAVVRVTTRKPVNSTRKLRTVSEDRAWNIGDLGPGELQSTVFESVLWATVTELTFFDSRGRNWRRDELGCLTTPRWWHKLNPVRVARRARSKLDQWRLERESREP